MSTDDLINQQLGQYQIKSVLGRGGMATVFLARQTSMDRDVAVKVMARDLADDEQFVARFEHEAQLIARLQHPHILPVIDFGREGKNVYIVMRLVTAGSLDDRLRRGALPLPLASRMLTQIASALTFAHEQGIIHRDLKPNNVLLDARDNAYLTDFGIAKMLAGTTKLTATGNILGTPAYMAPERWRGEAVDARTDIYSLGVMLYEMVLGRLPFSGDTPYTLMYKHFNDAPPPPRELNPNLDPNIEAVILRALAKNADDRYPSADALAEDFANVVRGGAAPTKAPATPPLDATVIGTEQVQTPPSLDVGTAVSPAPGGRATPPGKVPTSPPPQTPPPTPAPSAAGAGERRGLSPVLLGIAAVVVLAVLLGGGYLLFGGGDDDPPVETETAEAVVQAPTETPTSQPTDTDTPEPTATDTLEPTATATAEPTETPEPTATPRLTTATILSQQVNVRSGPGTDYDVLGRVSRDEEVVVIGVNEDGDWYQIIFGGQLGWVSAEFVRVSGNMNIPVVPWPTRTPTPSDTPTDTDTPEPTATATAEPTETPEPPPDASATPDDGVVVASFDPGVFVPVEFRTVALSGINVALDYPVNWLEPTSLGVVYSLVPVLSSDPASASYPTIVIARGSPDQLVAAGMITDTSSAVAAVEKTYGADFTGFSQPVRNFAFPAHKVDVRQTELHAWMWLVQIASDDWLHIVALGPTGEYDEAFAERVLNRIIRSMQVDQMALVPEEGPIEDAGMADVPVMLGEAFVDHFDDNANDWRFATIENGRLILDIPEIDYLGWAFPATQAKGDPAFYVQVTMQPIKLPNFYEYGLAFRVNSDSNFYNYVIDNNGQFILYSLINTEWNTLVGPTTSDLIQTGPDARNTLGVWVFGDYIELYLNGERVGYTVDSVHRTGDARVAAYTFSNSDGPMTIAFDDFVYLPLTAASDLILTDDSSAVIGTVTSGQVTIQMTPEITSTVLKTLFQGDRLVVLARTADNQSLFTYGNRTIGWIDARFVSLTRSGEPFEIGSLPVIAPTVLGVNVGAWPVIWPESESPISAIEIPPDVTVTLSAGQPVSGTLEAGDSATWTFWGTSGAQVTLEAAAANSQLDLYLTLTGPDGAVLVMNDDDGPGLNPLIEGYTLPAEGVYTVEVLSVRQAGDYTLTLTQN